MRCPREFSYRYVNRIAEPLVSPEQRLGKALHHGLELVLAGTPPQAALDAGRQELLTDAERSRFEQLAPQVGAFVQRIAEFRARRRPRAELIEYKLAIDAQVQPTQFLAQDAFFRGVLDAGFEWGDGELAVVDHKTGMRRDLAGYMDQLDGYAILAVVNSPQLKRIWRGVHFLAEGDVEWAPPIDAAAVRKVATPHLLAIIDDAGWRAADDTPTPGMHCNWCSYRNICPAAEVSPEPIVE